MGSHVHAQGKPAPSRAPSFTPAPARLLQRTCACGGTPGIEGTCAACQQKRLSGVQPKLAVNQPGDRYEQEADRIADQVMRMPDPAVQRQAVPEEEEEEDEMLQMKPLAAQITPLVQRETLPEEEEDEEAMLQMKPLAAQVTPLFVQRETINEEEDEEEMLQAKGRADAQAPTVTSSAEAAVKSARQGGGRPLYPTTRAFMGPRFGHDFSHVRVHTDSRAARAARAVNARAFTVGANVVFGQGQYAPETTAGQRLLAHELTHVVQQFRAKPDPGIGKPADTAELTACQPLGEAGRDAGQLSTIGWIPELRRKTNADEAHAPGMKLSLNPRQPETKDGTEDELTEKDAAEAKRIYQDNLDLVVQSDADAPDRLITRAKNLAHSFKETDIEMRLTNKAIATVILVIFTKLKSKEDEIAGLGLSDRLENIPPFDKLFVYEVFSDLGHLGIYDGSEMFKAAKQLLENRGQPDETSTGPPQTETNTETETKTETKFKGRVSFKNAFLGSPKEKFFTGFLGLIDFPNGFSASVHVGLDTPQWTHDGATADFHLGLGLPPMFKLGEKKQWKLLDVDLLVGVTIDVTKGGRNAAPSLLIYVTPIGPPPIPLIGDWPLVIKPAVAIGPGKDEPRVEGKFSASVEIPIRKLVSLSVGVETKWKPKKGNIYPYFGGIWGLRW